MGVVNVTPDSFSDGGRWFSHHDAVAHGHALLDQGADLLDIGGESTPGEATPEMAHRIGLELCKKILKDEYEFVLSTRPSAEKTIDFIVKSVRKISHGETWI